VISRFNVTVEMLSFRDFDAWLENSNGRPLKHGIPTIDRTKVSAVVNLKPQSVRSSTEHPHTISVMLSFAAVLFSLALYCKKSTDFCPFTTFYRRCLEAAKGCACHHD
jgi:hypothetical protein